MRGNFNSINHDGRTKVKVGFCGSVFLTNILICSVSLCQNKYNVKSEIIAFGYLGSCIYLCTKTYICVYTWD